MTVQSDVDPGVRWAVVALVVAAVAAASLIPLPDAGTPAAPGPVGADKLVHTAAYALLAATLVWALAGSGATLVPGVVVAFAGACAVGVGVELLQWPLSYRTASAADAVANAVGAGVVVAVWVSWNRSSSTNPR